MNLTLMIIISAALALFVLGMLKLFATLLWVVVLRRWLAATAALLGLLVAQVLLNCIVERFALVTSTAYYTKAGLLALFWLILVVPFANVMGFLLAKCVEGRSENQGPVEPFGWLGWGNWIFREAKRDLDAKYVPPLLLVPNADE